jgi:hypothetical protein
MPILHDVFRLGAAQNVAFNAAGGASASSAVFASQTRWILLSVVGVYAIASGVRVQVGDTPTAAATSTLLPVNFPMVVSCNPGQRVAVLSNDATTGNLSVTELE